MFGFGKALKQATLVGEAAARAVLAPFWDMFTRTFDNRIWSDPFVLGLIHAMIATQTLPMTGRKFNTEEKSRVLLDAMRRLGASQPTIDFSFQLMTEENDEFMRGYDTGLKTFFLLADVLSRERYQDADILAARDFLPTFDKMGRDFQENFQPTQGVPDDQKSLAMAYVYLHVKNHRDRLYLR